MFGIRPTNATGTIASCPARGRACSPGFGPLANDRLAGGFGKSLSCGTAEAEAEAAVPARRVAAAVGRGAAVLGVAVVDAAT